MTFFEHLEELRHRLKSVIIAVVLLFILFMTFGVGSVNVAGAQLPMLVPALGPGEQPVANQFFKALVSYLVPPSVGGVAINLTAKAPWDGVLAQIKSAFFLALVVSSPLTAYEVGRFIGPALKPSEKRLILRVTAPVLLLFLSGVVLCFVVVLPFTFRLLYSVQGGLGVTLYLLFLDDFINFVLLFLIAFGLAFQLPIIMYGLSTLGVVSGEFWKKYWRIAAIAIFFFGALITPDGSGVTMTLVAAPMLVLYLIGYLFVRRREKRMARAKSS